MAKPTKNRIVCPECGRAKMLFETEAKANKFIEYNGSDIDCEGELRAYYCPACCGYHITSKQHKWTYDNQTKNLIEAFKRDTSMTPMKEFDLIDELYNIICSFNVKSRKAVNKRLRQEEFNKYDEKIKQEARIRFYKEKNI